MGLDLQVAKIHFTTLSTNIFKFPEVTHEIILKQKRQLYTRLSTITLKYGLGKHFPLIHLTSASILETRSGDPYTSAYKYKLVSEGITLMQDG